MKTVIVGADGSEDGRRAVVWAAEVAAALNVPVIAVHAVGLLEHERGDPQSSHLVPQLAAWTAGLDDLAAGTVERRLVPGDPVSVLLRIAASEPDAVVVVGTRGRGAGAAVGLGGTSRELAERCRCPLVIVPRLDAEEA